MNNFKIVIIALCTVAVLFACSKKDNPPTPNIVGYWTGLYGTVSQPTPYLDYAVLFRSNGTVRVFDDLDTSNSFRSEGTYTVSGNTVKTTYAYVGMPDDTYSTSATLNANLTTMTGTWGRYSSTSGLGAFNLTKQ